MTRLVCSCDQTAGLLLVSSSLWSLFPVILSEICFASSVPSSRYRPHANSTRRLMVGPHAPARYCGCGFGSWSRACLVHNNIRLVTIRTRTTRGVPDARTRSSNQSVFGTDVLRSSPIFDDKDSQAQVDPTCARKSWFLFARPVSHPHKPIDSCFFRAPRFGMSLRLSTTSSRGKARRNHSNRLMTILAQNPKKAASN